MKVLLIEDDYWCVDILSIRLQSLGCEILVASNPTDGLQLATTAAPDLILTDLKLEHSLESGAQMIKALREHPATAATPLYVTSAYVYHDSDLPEMAGLADGYLPKPFKTPQLQAIIARHRPDAIATA
jgi:CheY-like chemotaxis protein